MQRREAASRDRCEYYKKSMLWLIDETDCFADRIYEPLNTVVADEASVIRSNINYLIEDLRNTVMTIKQTSEDVYKASKTLEEIEEVANYIARLKQENADSELQEFSKVSNENMRKIAEVARTLAEIANSLQNTYRPFTSNLNS